MKILMVNKFFYIKGGSETYYFALKRLLEKMGHEVIDFSMTDEKNFDSPYKKYYVKSIDYNNNSNFFEKMRSGINVIYSFEARRKFEILVKKTKPDLIHLHLFQHQLSPSILDIAKKYDIPTVYTAHDLKMICLNYKMMHHGKICEECRGEHYYRCAVNRCVKDSFFKSCINVAEGYFHKMRHSYDVIDEIITPSDFYFQKFIEFGVDSSRVTHIPNFTDADTIQIEKSADSEKYFLYFGRLSEEKGIMTLLHAVENSQIHIKIVGTGPLKALVEMYKKNNQLDNVEILGFMSGKELMNVIGNAKAVILPSEWYENGPYSAIESLQLARPIIGADIGGIPELVEHNGFLFKSGNAKALKESLQRMESLSENDYAAMQQKSLELFKSYYTEQYHYKMLKKVYQKAIRKHEKQGRRGE